MGILFLSLLPVSGAPLEVQSQVDWKSPIQYTVRACLALHTTFF